MPAAVEYDCTGAGVGVGFEDSGFFDYDEVDGMVGEVADSCDGDDDLRVAAGTASPSCSPVAIATAPSACPSTLSDDPTLFLLNSLDNAGITILANKLCALQNPLTGTTYTPTPHILAHHPEPPPHPSPLYTRLTRSRFRTSAEASAYRKRARTQPKSLAEDVARVKTFGRDYWVCRIFNAMIHVEKVTDREASVHRTRFTRDAAFEALDLEAAAHHVFDEAIAVHERGWNRPKVYHKHTVRGKLVDVSETSLELRLSRICLVLQQTKSAVDDAVRGGITLALLCDNPEARRHTKASNDAGNAKRGERLRLIATKERGTRELQAQRTVGVENEELAGSQVVGVSDGRD